jgi:2-methylcitrate dehydratase PrpD
LSASKLIEGKHGLLNIFGSKSSDHSEIVYELGTKWICEGIATKPYPACRLMHGAIDLAISLRRDQGGRSVSSIQPDISPLSNNIVGIRLPNKLHSQNNVDEQFSAYFQIAVTWLGGNQSGWTVYDRLLDSNVTEMVERISIKPDDQLSDLQTKMTVTYSDGTMQSEFCEAPLGEPSNPISIENVRKKYLSLAVPVFEEKRSGKTESAILKLESSNVSKIMRLLA